MPFEDNGSYEISLSQALGNSLRHLKHLATTQGRGASFTHALERITKALRRNPLAVGEPVYVLDAMGLQVRTVVVAPLVIDFAVDERRAIVYLKGCKLLSARAS